MRFRSSGTLLIAALFLLMLLPLPAHAELTQSDLVLVQADDVITEDLYAAGNRVQVDGRVEGDLYAVAFGEVSIAGEVTGDVVVVASRLVISGRVGGSVRVASGTVVIDGVVAEDVVVAAWNTGLGSEGSVGRDVISWGRNGSLAGRVERDVLGRFSKLQLDGRVAGAVEISVGRLSVGPTARVEGALGYRSSSEAEIVAVDLGGTVIHRTPLPPNIRLRALRLLTLALVMLILTAGGLVLAWAWPDLLDPAIAAAGRGISTWLGGLGIIASPLIAGGVLALLVSLSPPQAGIPLAIVFLPVIFGLGGLVLFGALLGFIPVAGALGRRLLPARSVAAAVLFGMAILGILLLVPWVKWLVLAAVIPLGIGSWVLKRAKATA